jgi:predicted Zn-dependent peptidase
LEHLHFKGSKKFPSAKKLSETVDSIGGEFNANTGKEHTQFFIRSAYEHLPLTFDVLTDMLKHPLLGAEEIEREKGVIIEEINMYRDNPPVSAESLFEESMWPESPLGRDIAGSPETVRAMTRSDILSFRKRFYQPANMIIAAAGKLDVPKFESMIGQHWSLLSGKEDFHFEEARNTQKKPRLNLKEKQTEQAHLVMGFKAFSYKHRHNQVLRILAAILGGGMSSRLFLKIRERMGLAYYISASINNYLDTGSFAIHAGLKVDKTLSAIPVILDELKRVRDNSIKPAELKKAKEYLKGKIALALEDPHDKLEWYLGQEAFMGRMRTIKQVFSEIDSVSAETVNEVAQKIIRPECLNLALVGPFKDKEKLAKLLTV